jgi:hypothetical protein
MHGIYLAIGFVDKRENRRARDALLFRRAPGEFGSAIRRVDCGSQDESMEGKEERTLHIFAIHGAEKATLDQNIERKPVQKRLIKKSV